MTAVLVVFVYMLVLVAFCTALARTRLGDWLLATAELLLGDRSSKR
jgi:hypothetical protein